MLYNKERPLQFKDVKGQEKVILPLKAAIAKSNTPNVLLFVGERGTGKTTVARILSRYVNCDNPGDDFEPCCTCSSCRSILQSNNMDVIELDAASNNKVDNIRELIDHTKYAPLAKYKVYILDEVHMLSTGAWNALLKTLEEPPQYCIFILCTTEQHKIPATIISRCRKFHFERIDHRIIVEHMRELCNKYNIAYEEEALHLISRASEGCMRDALSILEGFMDSDSVIESTVADTLGMAGNHAVFDILHFIQNADPSAAMDTLHKLLIKGTPCHLLVKEFISALTDTLFVLHGKDNQQVQGTTEYKEKVLQFGLSTNAQECMYMIDRFTSIYKSAANCGDMEFFLKTSILSIINSIGESNILQNKIQMLEQEIKKLQEKMDLIPEYGNTTTFIPNSASSHEKKLIKYMDNFSSDSLPGDVPYNSSSKSFSLEGGKETYAGYTEKAENSSVDTFLEKDSCSEGKENGLSISKIEKIEKFPSDFPFDTGHKIKGSASLDDLVPKTEGEKQVDYIRKEHSEYKDRDLQNEQSMADDFTDTPNFLLNIDYDVSNQDPLKDIVSDITENNYEIEEEKEVAVPEDESTSEITPVFSDDFMSSGFASFDLF